MLHMDKNILANLLNELGEDINRLANKNGFWEFGVSDNGTKIALIHSEVSEALEAIRKPESQMSKKIPEFSEVEDELADIIIRVLDFGIENKFRVVEAMIAKHEFNKTRPYKHGKKF